MKLSCDRQELLAALNLAASSVVPSRSTRPILQSLMIQATAAGAGAGVEVLATDLEVGLRHKVERADVEREGAALLPAAKATAILRELDGAKVELATDDNVTTIVGGESRFTIVGEDPREFPTVPAFGDAKEAALGFSLGRIDLERMIRKTAFAAATEGTRYALNGVLFHLRKGEERLRLVATDGKRLALSERPVRARTGEAAELKVVVPTKGVQLLERLAASAGASQGGGAEAEGEGGGRGEVELRFEEGQLLARAGLASMVAQLVQGTFPPYEEVIPQDHEKKVEIDVEAFHAALRRAALLTTKDSSAVRLAFKYNRVTLTARTPQVGESQVDLAVPYPYDPIEIGFNPQYVIDALKVLDADRATLELKQETAPGLLREGEGFLYVVMPVNLV